MKQTDQEIAHIKLQHSKMWDLVGSQLRKSFEAVHTLDKELAQEIIYREKAVNSQELVVDFHCENFIARFAPVAVDLRLILSILKINNNLERIGDFAESIALFVVQQQTQLIDADLSLKLQLQKVTDTALKMFEMAEEALKVEDSKISMRVLSMDDVIADITTKAVPILAEYITQHPEMTLEILYLSGVLRRIERTGGRISNIAEDTVFYLDAKELRHKKNNG